MTGRALRDAGAPRQWRNPNLPGFLEDLGVGSSTWDGLPAPCLCRVKRLHPRNSRSFCPLAEREQRLGAVGFPARAGRDAPWMPRAERGWWEQMIPDSLRSRQRVLVGCGIGMGRAALLGPWECPPGLLGTEQRCSHGFGVRRGDAVLLPSIHPSMDSRDSELLDSSMAP